MRLLLAFLIRDFHSEVSYRVSFALSLIDIVLRSLIFFFLSRLIGDQAGPLLQAYGGDYFSFVIIGVAFGSYFGVGLTGFVRALRQAQLSGTLEAMMMTPASVSRIIVGSALWSYVFTTFRVLVYLLVATLILGMELGDANYAAAFVSLVLSIVSFASVGIIAASVIMVFKRGDPISGLMSNLASLIGGVFYPVEIMPGWLQSIANLLPITYALRVMRKALIVGAPWEELATDITILGIFCLVLFPVSLILFRHAVDMARVDGSLAHY